jgi:hypothetical protein
MLANTSQDDITSILPQPLPGALELLRDGIGTTGSGHVVVSFQSCQFFAIFSRGISCKYKDYNGEVMEGRACLLTFQKRTLPPRPRHGDAPCAEERGPWAVG